MQIAIKIYEKYETAVQEKALGKVNKPLNIDSVELKYLLELK